MEDGLHDFVGLRCCQLLPAQRVLVLFCQLGLLLLLLGLEFVDMVPLQLFEIIISAEDNLLASEAYPHGIGGKQHLFHSLRPVAFQPTYQEVGQLERWHDLADSRVAQAWNEDPLRQLSQALQLVLSNDLEYLIEIRLELVEGLHLVVLRRYEIARQHYDLGTHALKSYQHRLDGRQVLCLV